MNARLIAVLLIALCGAFVQAYEVPLFSLYYYPNFYMKWGTARYVITEDYRLVEPSVAGYHYPPGLSKVEAFSPACVEGVKAEICNEENADKRAIKLAFFNPESSSNIWYQIELTDRRWVLRFAKLSADVSVFLVKVDGGERKKSKCGSKEDVEVGTVGAPFAHKPKVLEFPNCGGLKFKFTGSLTRGGNIFGTGTQFYVTGVEFDVKKLMDVDPKLRERMANYYAELYGKAIDAGKEVRGGATIATYAFKFEERTEQELIKRLLNVVSDEEERELGMKGAEALYKMLVDKGYFILKDEAGNSVDVRTAMITPDYLYYLENSNASPNNKGRLVIEGVHSYPAFIFRNVVEGKRYTAIIDIPSELRVELPLLIETVEVEQPGAKPPSGGKEEPSKKPVTPPQEPRVSSLNLDFEITPCERAMSDEELSAYATTKELATSVEATDSGILFSHEMIGIWDLTENKPVLTQSTLDARAELIETSDTKKIVVTERYVGEQIDMESGKYGPCLMSFRGTIQSLPPARYLLTVKFIHLDNKTASVYMADYPINVGS
jgi:hypothetical protein